MAAEREHMMKNIEQIPSFEEQKIYKLELAIQCKYVSLRLRSRVCLSHFCMRTLRLTHLSAQKQLPDILWLDMM
jgi:hypothetical protein